MRRRAKAHCESDMWAKLRRIEVRQKRKLIAALTNDNDRAEIDALFKRLRAPRKRP
jgi:hypothetical protein